MATFNANGWRGLPQLHEFSHPEAGCLDWQQDGDTKQATISQHQAWRQFQQKDQQGWCQRRGYLRENVLTFNPNSISAGYFKAPRLQSSARRRSKSWAGMTDWQQAVLCRQRREQECAGEVYLLTICYACDGRPVLDPPAIMPGHQACAGSSSLCQVAVMSVRLAHAWNTWLQVILWLETVTGISREDMAVQYIMNPRKATATTVNLPPPQYAHFHCPLVACFGEDLMPLLQLVRLRHSHSHKRRVRKAETRRLQEAETRRLQASGAGVDRPTVAGLGTWEPGCWPNIRPDGWWLGSKVSSSKWFGFNADTPDTPVWQRAGRALSSGVCKLPSAQESIQTIAT